MDAKICLNVTPAQVADQFWAVIAKEALPLLESKTKFALTVSVDFECDDFHDAGIVKIRLSQWQPIETAPKDGSPVLLFFPEFKRKIHVGYYLMREIYEYGKLTSKEEMWRCDLIIENFLTPGTPTHWMPMPEAPTTKSHA